MKRKFALMLCLSLLLVLVMSTGVLAADEYDMTAAITTTIGELTTQFWSIIGIIVPGVLAIIGGRLVITKGLSWFKSLTGKA